MTAWPPTAKPRVATRILVRFLDFLGVQRLGGLLLVASAVAAFIWANSPWAAAYFRLLDTEIGLSWAGAHFDRSLHWWINDGLMAFFFFVVGLEIKRQILVGELSEPGAAVLPIVAALGGMLTPALIYAAFNWGGPGAPGWGVPMATDIAFSLSVLSLLGKRVPPSLVVFLAALAIADDLGAIVVIALFYAGGVDWVWLGVGAAIMAVLIAANSAGVRKTGFYAAFGLGLWAAMFSSGIHATLAGVLVALTVPARPALRKDLFEEDVKFLLHEFVEEDRPGQDVLENVEQEETLEKLEAVAEAAESPLERVEHHLNPKVTLGLLPLFALANAGVALEGEAWSTLISPVALGAGLGLLIGKSMGITVFAWLAVKIGLAKLPGGCTWRHIHGLGWLAGIGFTMSLFLAHRAFAGSPLLDQARLGVFSASILAAVIGSLILRRGERDG